MDIASLPIVNPTDDSGRAQWAGFDGLTELPSERELRELGFNDHISDSWYYNGRVASGISINITVAKLPLAKFEGKLLYGYKELICDEFFGQPAYFGLMKEESRFEIAERINAELSRLRDGGLQLKIDPREYSWEDWADEAGLQGLTGEIDRGLGRAEPPRLPSPEEPIDLEILRAVAKLIDEESENLKWDSVAGPMSLGEYVAPTAIRAYLKLQAAKK